MLRQILQGEDWHGVFYAAVRAMGWGWPLVFFVSWIVLGQYVVVCVHMQ